MNQKNYVTPIETTTKTICLENIQATFTENTNGSYDVILEINSNKFLITIQKIANHIESMEIITSRGFIELSNKILLTIKKLIEYLRYKL